MLFKQPLGVNEQVWERLWIHHNQESCLAYGIYGTRHLM